ncbi:hypothetical protein C0Q70_04760 [Pomacea canaliculata]|uniref:Uncharacterized protein n=2 Tax=Pomacea canaliculata TaxID=400727 RepID=A0A2T7PJB1_POMCA|nr:hypothetical protein C0Q70_04760 [Pomacea canaliculata]
MWRKLKSAADSRNWTCVDDLLSASDVTRCDIKQSCLLHRLAAAPEVSLSLARDVITKILKHEVDINMVDTSDDTAVVVAARCDNTKMVMELLSRQAALPPDVTHVCSFLQTLTNNWKPQETPYMHALVVKLLWDRLQDTALHSCHKQLHHTLVRLAVTFHTSLVREMFVTKQQVNSLDSEGMAVLHRLAMFDSEDHVRVVHFLISKGADVNLQNRTGDTPLHVAAKHKNLTIMKALLFSGANSDVVDYEQQTVLNIMVSDCDRDKSYKIELLLPLLIHNNSDINKRDREGNTTLHLAALAGNTWFMKPLLDHGARADVVNDKQRTVLHMLAISGDLSVTHNNNYLLAIKKGAEVQKQDSDGNLAIHLAARHENWDLVKALLEYSDVNMSDSEGFNVLHRFAMGSDSSKYDMFHELIQNVSDINARCQTGDTAIHLAAKNNNWKIVGLLLKEGAIFEELDSDGLNILHRLAKLENWTGLAPEYESLPSRDSEYVEDVLLLHFRRKKISYNIPTPAGEVALHLAAKHNNWLLVKRLAEAGENINETDSEGLTVIQRLVTSTTDKACEQHSLFCHLLELGVDSTCDQNGDTLLHLAARNERWSIVQYLVSRGASADTPDSESFLILHRAASTSRRDSSALSPLRDLGPSILTNSSIIHKQTTRGDTAVHLAAQNEHWDDVMTLINHGANVFDTDFEHTSVLQRMVQSPSTLEWSISILHKAKSNTTNQNTDRTLGRLLYDAARCGRWEVVYHLLSVGVWMHQEGSERGSLLHMLAKGRQFRYEHQTICKAINLLLTKGIDLEDRCPDGNTALQLAAKFNNWNVVKCLAEQGANCKGPDSEGVFVLQRLAMYKDFHKDMIELEQLIFQKGTDATDLEDRCPNGNTALQNAAKLDNWDMVRCLVEQGANTKGPDVDGIFILQRLAEYKGFHESMIELVQLLLQSGADASICCSNGDSLLHLGSRANNWSFVHCIIRETDDLGLDKLDSDGFNVMHRLAQSDNGSDWLQKFLKKQFNLNTLSRNGDNCLLLAAKQENWTFVQSFLEFILRKNPRSPCEEFRDFMPEHDLFKDITNKIAFLGLLQNKDPFVTDKINLDQRDLCGYTVWHLAVRKQVLLVGHLAECGADTDLVDDEGLGVLHTLASNNSVNYRKADYLLKLISKKRHVIVRDELGNTPLQVAAKKENLLFITLLRDFFQTYSKDSDGLPLLHRIVKINPLNDPYMSLLINIVKYLLMSRASVNEMSVDNETPLQIASKFNNWSVVGLLLEHGAQANMCDSEGQSVLHRYASLDWSKLLLMGSQVQLAQKLLDAGADIQLKDLQGNTPLHLAIQHSNLHVAQELVVCGADVREVDSEGYTVLHRMAQIEDNHDLECQPQPLTQLLLDRGARCDIYSNSSETILDIVTEHGNWWIMKCLLEQGVLAKAKLKRKFILHKLASCTFGNSSTDVCQLLIENGLSVNAKDPDGNTPLHLAASAGNWYLVVHLIQKGASVRTVNRNGRSILHRFFSDVKRIDGPSLEVILTSGVLHAADPRGNTTLHMAAKRELFDMVDRLLDCVQNINIKDSEGFTVLLRLSQTPHPKCLPVCQRLVEAGADINTCSSSGVSALELAIRSNNWPVVYLLLHSGGHFDVKVMDQFQVLHHLIKCLPSAIPFDNLLKVVTLLANSVVSLNKSDSSRQTPADLAFKHEKWDVLVYLLEQGVRLNNSERPGSSVFLELAKNSSDGVKATSLLIRNGLDINLKNSYGKTPVHVAADEDRWDIVKIFVEHGADVNIPDRNGYSLHHKLLHPPSRNEYRESNFALLCTLVQSKADVN